MTGRRWRDYRTVGGNRPVKAFLDELSDGDAAKVVAAMRQVADVGERVAHHLRGEIYEVRAAGHQVAYRVLYSIEGRRGRVLLALVAIAKKTRKTPVAAIRLAERRLADWRSRGSHP